jgi:hypothetical protein
MKFSTETARCCPAKGNMHLFPFDVTFEKLNFLSCMPSLPLTTQWSESLQAASALLAMDGSFALRSQAQQQAALQLLQARRLGAEDNLLEDVLRTRIHACLAQLLREVPLQFISPSPQLNHQASLQERVAVFLRAQKEEALVRLEEAF